MYEAAQRDGTRGKLKLEDGCTNDDNPFGMARYRTAGDYIEFYGALTRNFSTERTLAFVLPEELWPKAPVEAQVFVDIEANTAEAVLFIGTDGRGEIMSLTRVSPFDPAPTTEIIMLNGLVLKIK